MDAAPMSDDEIDLFLREQGTGTLSLTRDRESYAFPESFGYDGDSLYFQFVYAEDSRKMSFLESTDIATFSTYSEGTPTKSVIVRGEVGQVPQGEESLASSAFAANSVVPMLNVTPAQSVSELAFDFYRLEPTELAGRKFGPDVD